MCERWVRWCVRAARTRGERTQDEAPVDGRRVECVSESSVVRRVRAPLWALARCSLGARLWALGPGAWAPVRAARAPAWGVPTTPGGPGSKL